MKAAEAHEIAAETIAYWQAQGITAREAWAALGLGPVWHADWWEVRGRMEWWLTQCGAQVPDAAFRLAA